MKTLIVYSTISGNTKAVCERIYNALNVEKEIINVKDSKNIKPSDYENIIIGFWCDKGTMDKDSIDFLKTLNNKNLYFLGTLGARPDSEHWNDVFENAKKLCSENNIFKAMGLNYIYVDEGNDIEELISAFKSVKNIGKPIVVHLSTNKGNGFKPAEINKEDFHTVKTLL